MHLTSDVLRESHIEPDAVSWLLCTQVRHHFIVLGVLNTHLRLGALSVRGFLLLWFANLSRQTLRVCSCRRAEAAALAQFQRQANQAGGRTQMKVALSQAGLHTGMWAQTGT